MVTNTPTRKKNFSSFSKKEAFKQLGLTDLLPWRIEADPIPPSPFFQEHLKRLQQHFDLESTEESKKLLIDAIASEALEGIERIKLWKSAPLEGETTCGVADYLGAERKRYLEAPLLCIIEAKKDDFEQGMAQCLVEMQACQWENQCLGLRTEIYGLVTNGSGWVFYRLMPGGEVYETLLYSVNDLATLIGALHNVFRQCERYLEVSAQQ